MAGRRSLFTPERAQFIINAIGGGTNPEIAAQGSGINPRTYYDWMARGRADQEQPVDPDKYTMRQLRALAAAQGVELPEGRLTRKRVAPMLYEPTPFSQFSQEVTRALAQAQIHALREGDRTGIEDWRYWAWKLEHRWPDDWARGREIPVPGTKPGEIDQAAALEAGKVRLKVVEGGKP